MLESEYQFPTLAIPNNAWNNIKISTLHCQPSKQPLVEMHSGMDDGTKDKNWKTKKHMGLANRNVLPMATLGRMADNSNADRCLADTYGFLG